MSYNRSIDSTQAAIAPVWRQFGFWVHDLHLAAQVFKFEHLGETVYGGIPDLLCQMGTLSVWVECKAAGGAMEESEDKFLAGCQCRAVPMVVNWGIEDAMRDAAYWRGVALALQRSGAGHVR